MQGMQSVPGGMIQYASAGPQAAFGIPMTPGHMTQPQPHQLAYPPPSPGPVASQMTYQLVPVHNGIPLPHMAHMPMQMMSTGMGMGMGMGMPMPMGMMHVPAPTPTPYGQSQPFPMGGYVLMQQVVVPAEQAHATQGPAFGMVGMPPPPGDPHLAPTPWNMDGQYKTSAPTDAKDRSSSSSTSSTAKKHTKHLQSPKTPPIRPSHLPTPSPSPQEPKTTTITTATATAPALPTNAPKPPPTPSKPPPPKPEPLNKKTRIPRPPNSFILYRREKHPHVLSTNPTISNNEISKIVAKMWREEPDDVKWAYKMRSEEEAGKHREEFPGYKFRPRKCIAKRRKRGVESGKDDKEDGKSVDGKSVGSYQSSEHDGETDPSAPPSPDMDMDWGVMGGQAGGHVFDQEFASYLAGLDAGMFARVAGLEDGEGWEDKEHEAETEKQILASSGDVSNVVVAEM
ncbi:hypothetical protein HDV00_005291 [Rhizophlyctis rosea]|nr:hypothetical protein HDV00_005291 [Rhizophlyctis rosea]